MTAQPLVTPAGSYDLSAIMGAAHALCWTLRTTATGSSLANIEFHTTPVYDRSRLSIALKAVWKQARRQRMTWRINQPEALAHAEAQEVATRARWAAERAAIKAAIAAATPALPEPFRLAA